MLHVSDYLNRNLSVNRDQVQLVYRVQSKAINRLTAASKWRYWLCLTCFHGRLRDGVLVTKSKGSVRSYDNSIKRQSVYDPACLQQNYPQFHEIVLTVRNSEVASGSLVVTAEFGALSSGANLGLGQQL